MALLFLLVMFLITSVPYLVIHIVPFPKYPYKSALLVAYAWFHFSFMLTGLKQYANGAFE